MRRRGQHAAAAHALSGIGPAAHLAEHGIRPLVDAPEVGANLQDHLVAGLSPEARGGTLFGAEKPASSAATSHAARAC